MPMQGPPPGAPMGGGPLPRGPKGMRGPGRAPMGGGPVGPPPQGGGQNPFAGMPPQQLVGLLVALIQALAAQGIDPGQALQMIRGGGQPPSPPMPGGGPPGPAGGPGTGAGQAPPTPRGGNPMNLMG